MIKRTKTAWGPPACFLAAAACAEIDYDLVVGNVPFVDIPITDRETNVKLSLHHFFLWRAVQALRPGGYGDQQVFLVPAEGGQG